MKFIFLIYLLGTPLLLMNLARKYTWINKVAPMTLLYIIGLIVANFSPIIRMVAPWFGMSAETAANIPSVMEFFEAHELNSLLQSLTVPLAIPLMLMGCNLKKWSGKTTFKTFMSGLISVLIVSIGGFFLFRGDMPDQEFAQVCAVITGQYTGGIPNVGPIAKAVDISEENLLYLTSCDLIITGLYLIFIIFFGKKVFHWVLPAPKKSNESKEDVVYDNETKQIFPFDKKHWRQSLLVIGVTIIIAAISYLAASIGGELNMTILILLLTTLSICASFFKPMQQQESSFDMGLYCVYVFCLTIASACDISTMNIANCLNILFYVTVAIFGSLVLQIIFAKIWKIDGDSVLVCSIALINSPPFVPMVAAALDNRDIMITGISIGVMGYILGNYLGIGVYNLLLAFC